MSRSRDSSSTISSETAPEAGNSRASLRDRLVPSQIWWAALVAGLLFFGPLVVSLIPDLSHRSEYRVSAEQITLTQGPEWVPADLVQQVFANGGFLDNELSLHESTLSERIAAAFHTHPWIEKVVSVRKTWPAHVQVNVLYRRPVALIRTTDGLYPVDRYGVLLPAADFSPEDMTRYPVIEGIRSAPAGRLGEAWGDAAVTEAAQLAEVLLQEQAGTSWWKHLQLQGIEVPQAPQGTTVDSEFELVTPGGSRILWGRGPSTSHPGELDVQQKLDRLRELQSRYGSFDGPHGPWQIDIRSWRGIRRTAMAPSQPATDRIR